jgi:hypothetical protein
VAPASGSSVCGGPTAPEGDGRQHAEPPKIEQVDLLAAKLPK